MLEAIIFDNDGVLVDSEPLHHVAEIQTVAAYGYKLEPADFMRYVGVSTEIMLRDWIDQFNLDATVEELGERHQENLIHQFEANLLVMPGIPELLADLSGHSQKIAVASSSTRILVQTGLQKLGLWDYFDAIVCGDDVQRTKPDPMIYFEVARLLELPPAACIVIEDSFTGVTAAKAAGMCCIGYQSANSGQQDLSQADYLITRFDELRNGKLPDIFNRCARRCE
ncbi:HAD family phosphatase [candidate division KSB1 bacterium]|nr:HAD family phosphatase [candidate division KSB1 bacterium]